MKASPKSSKAPAQPKKAAKKSPKKNGKRRFAKARSRKSKQASKKARGGTKTALDYCEMMHRIFAEQDNDPNPLRKFITVEELARMFELDRATIKRYLSYMRTRLHLPVRGIRARGGQGYTEKVHAFPLHTLTHGDMFLFVVAKGALGKGSPFEHKFPPLCAKVEHALQSDEVDLKKLESIVHFHDAGFDARVFADPELWDFLAKAIMDCREIEFDHLKAEPGATPTHRVIKPLSLHEIGRAWYVWCPDDDNPGKFKKFALSRMDRVERTGVTFKPIKFDPVAYLKGIGAFTGGPAQHVHLHITRKAAHLIPERPIHPTQKITVRPDGSIDVTLFVAHTPELENWINLLAGNVEVLTPQTLREVIYEQQTSGSALNRGLPNEAHRDFLESLGAVAEPNG